MKMFDPHQMGLISSLWVIIDPLGCIPLIMLKLRGYSVSQQYRILMREGLIGLILMVGYFMFGSKVLFGLFGVSAISLRILGGVILAKIGYDMLISHDHKETEIAESMVEHKYKRKEDILIFPIAFPLIAGPGSLTFIIANQNTFELSSVIITWILAFGIILFSPLFSKINKKIQKVITLFFGFLTLMIAIDIFLDGIRQFILSI